MVKAGIWMNIISIILLSLIVFFVLPVFWDFVPDQFPDILRKE
jgi:sodium-dependent dicarboxylate transporter 2/3/5